MPVLYGTFDIGKDIKKIVGLEMDYHGHTGRMGVPRKRARLVTLGQSCVIKCVRNSLFMGIGMLSRLTWPDAK